MQLFQKMGRAARAAGTLSCIGIAFLMARPAPADDVQSQTLIYAVYEGENTAGQVFKTMKENQKATGEKIVSYAIVSKDMKGKVHVKDQRHRDAKVGAILGGVIGVLGGPAGAVAGAAVGGSAGYLTGDQVGMSKDTVEQMESSLTPGSSALSVVLEDKWVEDVEKSLRQANARSVVADKIAAGAKNPAPPQ